ncbi:MAG: coenzyme F420-0:L-glutamate ligase [Candidatus Thorarchaeota archaeon]|jgi:coenzyme F420-0:L-glutamate ligase
MQIFPIKTRTITPEDSFLDIIIESMEMQNLEFRDGDILGIAETPLGTTEGQIVKLSDVRSSKRAKGLASEFDMLPEVAELVLREADEILGGIPHVLLTIRNNTLMANAGVDKSNVPSGYASILPKNPRESANQIRLMVQNKFEKMIGVMVIDSRTQPLRLGNIGMALGVSGFKPVADDRGRKDLFGNELRITRRAIADNLASACTLIRQLNSSKLHSILLKCG